MDLQVIILATGERTAEVAEFLAKKETENVVVINDERPFAEKLKEGFAYNNNKWAIMSNGDLLIKPGAIKSLYEYAEKHEDEIFAAYGIIDCKFLGKRYASPKIYKTSFFPALKEAVKDTIRPEASAIGGLKKDGKKLHEINLLTAIHDYEQYYADIYIKGYVFGVKFYEHVMKYRFGLWEQQKRHDPDIQVVIKGFEDGVKHKGELKIDRAFFDKAKILSNLKIEEKKPIPIINNI